MLNCCLDNGHIDANIEILSLYPPQPPLNTISHTMLIIDVYIKIDVAPITGLVETRSGLAWSPPANAIGCSFDYVVTENGSELTRAADISYNYTFPPCQDLTITVTPVVPSTGQVLTSSSASINIFKISPGKYSISRDVLVEVE